MNIAILGGYGSIGLEVTKLLSRNPGIHLRLGGRKTHLVPWEVRNCLKQHTLYQVDTRNHDCVREFVSNCELVVNTSGLFNSEEMTLAKVAAAENIPYLSSSGDNRLEQIDSPCLVYQAGSLPGISGIIPRVMCEGIKQVERIKFIYAVRDVFSPAAAREYIQGLWAPGKLPMTVYESGKRVPYRETCEITLPWSDSPLCLFPYLDQECDWLEKTLQPQYGCWMTAMEKGDALQFMKQARALFTAHPDEAVDQLCKASQKDCQNKKTYAGIVLEVVGYSDSCSTARTLLIHSTAANRMTAAAVTAGVELVLTGKLRGWKGPYSAIPQADWVFNGFAIQSLWILPSRHFL